MPKVSIQDPLFWFSIETPRGKLRIWLATTEGCEALIGNDGVCFPSDGDAFINVGADAYRQGVVTLHEIMHYCVSGVKFVSHENEERLIRYSDAPLFGVLQQRGFMWPRKPDGYLALKRKASRLEKVDD